MRSYTERDAALAIDCARCHAEPGHVCVSDDGQETVPVHDVRLEDLNGYIKSGVVDYDAEGMTP